jgi:phosphatidylserine/phosphatidylglycerophosphate/cardiolipin synthase-like enzyme
MDLLYTCLAKENKMFKIFSSLAPETYVSTLYDEQSFFFKFLSDFSRARSTVTIESPYLTVKRCLQFTPVFEKLCRRGVRIEIYTREPSHHDFVLEDQALKSLKILKAGGARIYLCSDMRHRKLAIIDKEILWEGSLNILSQSTSKEIMRRTNSPEQCTEMLKFTKLS